MVNRAPLGICGTICIQTKYPSLTRWRIDAPPERERERKREKRQFHNTYQDIISVENLFAAWQEFLPGKRMRDDVDLFAVNLMGTIMALHHDLANKTYRHGEYVAFKINDPKPRDIHKATVRDRLLHRAIYRMLYPYFDRTFIFDSYSCREGKGTHRAINRLREFAAKVSNNHTCTAWVLKCDIRKFFANINHTVLLDTIKWHMRDQDILWLLEEVMGSFHTNGRPGVGLPLGNLTSQLLVNIYMNPFDHFMKRKLKVSHYIRYADDFVIIHQRKEYLQNLLPDIADYLTARLHLELHPDKVSIATLASGVDFLGWVHFPYHRVLRASTKRRMFRNIGPETTPSVFSSYLGMLNHGNANRLKEVVEVLARKVGSKE